MRPIIDRSGTGKDKLRVLFHIDDKEKAKALYEMVGVNRQNALLGTDKVMQIYFLLPEEKFEQYADVAAAKYNEEEQRRQEENEIRMKAERERRELERQSRAGGRGGDRGQKGTRQGGRNRD